MTEPSHQPLLSFLHGAEPLQEDPTLTRTTKRVARTRRKLQRAALACFAEFGIDAATIEEITEKADVGKGTFYRHFASKDELVVELVRETLEHLAASVVAARVPAANAESMLQLLFDAYSRLVIQRPEHLRLLRQAQLAIELRRPGSDELERLFGAYWEALERELARVGRCAAPAPMVTVTLQLFIDLLVTALPRLVAAPDATAKVSLKHSRRAFVKAALALLDDGASPPQPSGTRQVSTPPTR